MKGKILICLLFLNVLGYAAIYDSPAFKIKEETSFELSKSYYDMPITNDITIPLDINKKISGLALTGKTKLQNENAIVRIILIDNEGKEYLVFEDFYMFPEEEEHEFFNVAMETVVLDNIIPQELKLYVSNAQLDIYKISSVAEEKQLTSFALAKKREDKLAVQEDYLIERWNKFNVQTGQYWIAGKTSISGLSYSAKKKILGAISDSFLSDGVEYYTGGIFVIKARGEIASTGFPQSNTTDMQISNIAFAESFDWRNRHGKNWMTPVKNQENPFNNISGNNGCWVFAPIAAIESMLNLYYNQLLNVDLSEQEIGSCTNAANNSLHKGGYVDSTLNFIHQNGVVDETCFPFQNDSTIPCQNICDEPNQIVHISDYSIPSWQHPDTVKKWLIKNGPLSWNIMTNKVRHSICLCGYKTIHAGDSLKYYFQNSNIAKVDTIIPANSNLIGKNCWIFKNSYGLSYGVNGYLYAVFESEIMALQKPTHIQYPVTTSILTTDDIVCEDADHDGYYFWGLGQKPTSCPICCPDIPDGDDSNPQLAEMDEYGNFSAYTFPYPTITITSNTIWSTNQTQCGNIIVTNNATLTISAELTMNPVAKITVQNGGTLIVDGGSIINATVEVQNSAKIQLQNNGTLYLKQLGNLKVLYGAEAEMEYGRVLLQ